MLSLYLVTRPWAFVVNQNFASAEGKGIRLVNVNMAKTFYNALVHFANGAVTLNDYTIVFDYNILNNVQMIARLIQPCLAQIHLWQTTQLSIC